jgi:hypothetical protein
MAIEQAFRAGGKEIGEAGWEGGEYIERGACARRSLPAVDDLVKG